MPKLYRVSTKLQSLVNFLGWTFIAHVKLVEHTGLVSFAHSLDPCVYTNSTRMPRGPVHGTGDHLAETSNYQYHTSVRPNSSHFTHTNIVFSSRAPLPRYARTASQFVEGEHKSNTPLARSLITSILHPLVGHVT